MMCEGVGQDLAGCGVHFVQFEIHLSEEIENRSLLRSKKLPSFLKKQYVRVNELITKSNLKKKKNDKVNHYIQI